MQGGRTPRPSGRLVVLHAPAKLVLDGLRPDEVARSIAAWIVLSLPPFVRARVRANRI
jgi:hypothetical protein